MVITESNGRPLLVGQSGDVSGFAQTLEWGYRLAETDVGVTKDTPGGLWAAKGWKQFVEHIPDINRRATAAIMLENCRRMWGKLNEVTRTANLGSFDKWIFPVISNMAENDVIDQLVALQPMPGPTSQIVYMDIVTSQAKGNIPQGTQVWRALAGAVDRWTDSDEYIPSESPGSTTNSGAAALQLAYTPVRPGTTQITCGAATATDDGNGNLVALSGNLAGTINYVAGSITLTGGAAATAVTVSYVFDSEGSLNIQGYEMKLTSSPVTAQVYKLKTIWSEEADQNLQAMYNIKAENILLSAITNALRLVWLPGMLLLRLE